MTYFTAYVRYLIFFVVVVCILCFYSFFTCLVLLLTSVCNILKISLYGPEYFCFVLQKEYKIEKKIQLISTVFYIHSQRFKTRLYYSLFKN